MSNPLDANAAPFDLGPGLDEFYSSQAILMLSQYENIERLLGPTSDWTPSGTYCEILLRSFLRSHLPSRFSLGKGFIYGRRDVGAETRHCPEIDVLIHDAHDYPPLLQVEDFVIVQAKAVRAAIQIKRRMDNDQLRKGLKNVIDAREHLAYLTPDHSPRRIASAVVFFDEKCPGTGGKPTATYRNCIEEMFASRETWEFAPDFIGSLQHHFYWRSSDNLNRIDYAGYPAIVDGRNIAVQFLLWKITYSVSGYGTQPPMAVPQMLKPHVVDRIEIFAPTETEGEEETQEGGRS